MNDYFWALMALPPIAAGLGFVFYTLKAVEDESRS